MGKKLLLVVNPVSGKARVKTELFGILETFSRAGFSTEIYLTRGPGDGTRKVEEDGKGFDIIAACGGDGTLNEVVTGAMRISFRGDLGFLPCGTTNDFASSLSIPKNLIRASRLITEEEGKKLDFGAFNGERFFSYIAVFGAFSDVSYTTDQRMKHVFGHVAYVFEAIAHLQEMRSYRVKVTCDGVLYEEDVLFGATANSLSIGGVMKLKPDLVDMTDGYHEVLLVRNPKNAGEMAQLSRELLSGNFKNQEVLFFRGKHVVFECEEEIPWCVDGEFAGNYHRAEVDNLHDKLRIIYPGKKD